MGRDIQAVADVRYVTFVHRSPFATWNPLSAWCREQGRVPDEVVVLHGPGIEDHVDFVTEGIQALLRHYGADVEVRHQKVPHNRIADWSRALRDAADGASKAVVDITPSRTVPKLAVTAAFGARHEVDVFYLDVADYRYEPKPFSWLPYNQQQVRHLLREDEPLAHGVQALALPTGIPTGRTPAGATLRGPGRLERVVPWNALTVLLNEAAAAKDGPSRQEVTIKLPHLGFDVGAYDLRSRTLRLEPLDGLQDCLVSLGKSLTRPWKEQLPRRDHVETALAAARIVPYEDEASYVDLLHEAAWETRGVTMRDRKPIVALDTNLFYHEFLTAIAHTAKIPTARIPIVVSSITEQEIRYRLHAPLPPDPMPEVFADAEVHRSLRARLARAAFEEFLLFRQRCRMTTIEGHEGQADNDANDLGILRDFDAHAKGGQPLVVLSSDIRFVERARDEVPDLDVRRVRPVAVRPGRYEDVDIDQVAYLVFQLAIGFGRVNLKGLDVTVFGDHPEQNSDRYFREEVRLAVPDRPWIRGFLHEVSLRERLEEVVREKNWWV